MTMLFKEIICNKARQGLLALSLTSICSPAIAGNIKSTDDEVPCSTIFLGCEDDSPNTSYVLETTVLVIAGIYYLSKADSPSTPQDFRRLNDFANGRGYRLTDYETPLNVSLFSFEQNQHSAYFKQDLTTHFNANAPERRFNLIEMSTSW